MRLSSLLFTLALILTLIVPVFAADKPPMSATATTSAEAALGKHTAEEIEKEFKLVADPVMLAKLNAMAAEIAPFTQRPDVVYTCKILDTDALNAMAIPGGTIYFTKGLLKAVESDHEIAGVMAHEIAHNSLYHSKKMLEREKGASLAQIASVLAAIYVDSTHPNSEVSPIEFLSMSEMVKQSLLNGYSVELEIEADRNAIDYLSRLKKYDPVGLYSVILGFRKMEKFQPQAEMGYLQTHPCPEERKVRMEKRFAELHIPINIWNVVDFRASVTLPAEGERGYTLKLGDVQVITFNTADSGHDVAVRAQEAANAINRRLTQAEIHQFDVDVDHFDGHVYVRIRHIPVFTLTQADADASGVSLDALGARTKQSIKEAIWREMAKRN